MTGANFMLDLSAGGADSLRILLDCGLLHGQMYSDSDDFPYDPATVDVLIVSHAHADHIGKIPKLVKDGFKGVIYSTPATRDISAVMLEDAQKILAQEAMEQHREPLYLPEHIDAALRLWQTVPYHTDFSLGDVQARFKDAGHILGSAMVELERGGKKFVYTGDLGNTPAPLLCDTELLTDVTYLVMESVYGDRNHEGKGARTHKLAEAIAKIAKTKGTLLIPAFSLQRTQILLYEINKLVEGGTVPSIPVYVDSPLGARVTGIFRGYTELLNSRVRAEIAKGDDIFSFPKLIEVRNAHESARIDTVPGPKVLLSSSGMSVGGRILAHEEELLQNKENMILFVGYQAVGTLGRRIQEGNKTVRINNKYIRVHAKIDTIDGYSGHKDSEHLVEFVSSTAQSIERVYVVMGEPRSSLYLAQRLHDFLGINTVVPAASEAVTLDF